MNAVSRTSPERSPATNAVSRTRLVRSSTLLMLAVVAAALAAGCAHTGRGYGEKPRNVVLMIGDGMGVAHVTAAMVVGGPLNMERMPEGGFVTTHAANTFLTDSAASGTALATGHKTNNGMVSVTPDGEHLKTVLEYAEDAGMSTGLVTTCSITHATPAVFVSHVESRDDDLAIARQVAASQADVLFGGGLTYFVPKSQKGGARDDDLDLLSEMRKRMNVALTPDEFEAMPGKGAAAALLYRGHPPRAGDRQVSLAEMTSKALDILSDDEDGFFLMVEGSQIDWAGHENDEDWLIEEMIDFDEAVGEVLDFAEEDKQTLVVVTADHECGGYLLIDASPESRKVTWWKFGTDTHTATMVPLLAYGPGSNELGGIRDNTSLGRILIGHVRR